MKEQITAFIDFFHPLFRRIMPIQTFRYAACGGMNVALDITLYFLSYHYIFNAEVVSFGFVSFEPYVAAFLFSFCITFPTGFLLSKYIVWTRSNLKGRIQFLRYFMLVVTNVILNYLFLKVFIEFFDFFPTIAKVATTVILVIISYLTNKHFTFKVKEVVS
jgi:putative flippase GtrA